MKNTFKFLLISLFLCSLSSFAMEPEHSINHTESQHPIITVFVHGTYYLPYMPKHLINCIHPFIDNLFFTKKGLHHIDSLEEHYSQAWIKQLHNYHMARTISDAAPEKFPFKSFYIFCWSGELNAEERSNAAQELHGHLMQLATIYTEEHGTEPYLQVITHSHGGNVALNLAKINETSEKTLSINELILLACPVQYKTSSLIHNPMFKKIYSLYSHWDINQIIDAQGWEPFKERIKSLCNTDMKSNDLSEKLQDNQCFFSEREFPDDKKLIQANIHCGIRGMLHHEFNSGEFLQKLPALLKSLERPTADKNDLNINPYHGHSLNEKTIIEQYITQYSPALFLIALFSSMILPDYIKLKQLLK